MKKAVFLDRDGVLLDDSGQYYIYRIEEVKINSGVIETLKELSERGFLLIVISNQGGIARGLYSKIDVEKIHKLIAQKFKSENIEIKEFYYCPHHSDHESCLCRKPEPLLFEKAMARFNIAPGKSFVIGDNNRDIEAGKKAGLAGIKIKPNQNLQEILPHVNT